MRGQWEFNWSDFWIPHVFLHLKTCLVEIEIPPATNFISHIRGDGNGKIYEKGQLHATAVSIGNLKSPHDKLSLMWS